MLDEKGANMRHLGTEKSPKGHTWVEKVAKMLHLGRKSSQHRCCCFWGSRKWVFGGEMHRVDLQNCDPHGGQEAFFQKKSEKYCKWWKKGPKRGQLAHAMHMLGALVRPRAAEPIST